MANSHEAKMRIESYQQLEVWKKAVALVTEIYRVTQSFPKEEMYGLTSQLRRAAVSVPANIAEGWGRNMTGEYIQFLRTARGSLLESETHLLIAKNLNFIDDKTLEILFGKTRELNKMLNSLISSLEAGRK